MCEDSPTIQVVAVCGGGFCHFSLAQVACCPTAFSPLPLLSSSCIFCSIAERADSLSLAENSKNLLSQPRIDIKFYRYCYISTSAPSLLAGPAGAGEESCRGAAGKKPNPGRFQLHCKQTPAASGRVAAPWRRRRFFEIKALSNGAPSAKIKGR